MTTAPVNLKVRPHPALHDKQGGFTLFEVMVAVVVLVIGVLGAAAMTITAIRNGQQAGLRSTAVNLAYEASDIMRGNFTQYVNAIPPGVTVIVTTANSGSGVGLTTSCFNGGSGCTPAQMAQNDFFVWRQKVQNALPGGEAVICFDNGTTGTPTAPNCSGTAGALVVKIWWTEKTNNSIGASTAPNLIVPIQPI